MSNTNYNYQEAIKNDIRGYINEHYTEHELRTEHLLNELFGSELNDELFCCDYVTGNASGSYTFNSYLAESYVKDNFELLKEALQEFCVESDVIVEHFFNDDYEYFDVTIRCYLLSHCVYEVIEELRQEYNIEI